MSGWIILLLLMQVILNTAAQLLLKRGVTIVGDLSFSWDTLSSLLFKVAASPYIILGCGTYVCSMICCLLVLSKVQVSVAYPIGSLGYVLSAFAACYFLDERLTNNQWLGIAVIILGVFLLVRDI